MKILSTSRFLTKDRRRNHVRLADSVVLSESMNVVNCIDAGEENEECCNIEMSLKPGSDSGDYETSKISEAKVVKSCLKNKKDLSGKTPMTSTPTTTTASNDVTEPCLDENNRAKALEDKLKNIVLSETLSTVPSDLSQGKEDCYNVELSLQPSIDEITCSQSITSPSMKTRYNFFKVFGERNGSSKSLPSSSNNKTPSFRNGRRVKMIAVDEVERKIVKKRSDETISSGISTSASFVLNRSNSRIGLGNSRTLSNLSQVHKNIQLAKIKKNPSSKSMTRLDLKKSSSSLDDDIPEPTNATPFNFAITLDSLGGIVCLNPQNREKATPAVVISYYSKSETGQAVKRNICSLPLTKIFSGKNNDYEDEVVYGAKFNEKIPLNVSLLMGANKKSTSGYTPRALNLEVSLMKDNEIIKLGKAILTLSGDEYEAERSVPVGTIKIVTSRTGNKKLSAKKVSKVVTSGLEMVWFRSNPKTKYVLHNAFLNICSIQAESSDLNDVYKSSMQELMKSDTVLSDEYDDEDDVTESGLTFDSCMNTLAASSAYSRQFFTENGDEIASEDDSGVDDDNSSMDDSDCQSGTTCTDDASSFRGSMFSGSTGTSGYEASEGHSLATLSGSFSDDE